MEPYLLLLIRLDIATPFLYTICKEYNVSADYLLGKINKPQS